MKILYIEWASFGNEDMKEAFTKEGHTLVCLPFSNKDTRRDEVVEAEIASALHNEVPDVVFSFNYFPLISNVCKKENIKYRAFSDGEVIIENQGSEINERK